MQIIKELKDPSNTHKYNAKKCIAEINSRLEKLGIDLIDKNEKVTFNIYHFRLFCDYFNLKDNEKYCYIFHLHSTPNYGYSVQAIDFIVDEIRKDPEHIIQSLKEKLKK